MTPKETSGLHVLCKQGFFFLTSFICLLNTSVVHQVLFLCEACLLLLF